MPLSSLLLVDLNELRLAALAALLQPWAREAKAEIHFVRDPERLPDLASPAPLACIYSIGSLSLRDPAVSVMIDRMRSLFPNSPLIVLSDTVDSLEIAMAICVGLRGFIPTTMSPHVALAALNFIINGGTYYPHSATGAGPAVTGSGSGLNQNHQDGGMSGSPRSSEPSVLAFAKRQQLINGAAIPPTPRLVEQDPLMDPLKKKRHVEVLKFLVQGETNKEIARHLNLTEATIKVYVRELMRHFGAKNRMQVALKASTTQSGDLPDLVNDQDPVSAPILGTFPGVVRR